MNSSEQLDKLAPALSKAQSEMGGAVKDSKNPFFKSNYADLTAVWKACKDALHSNGFSVIQSPVNDEGRIGVSTMLLHDSGQYIKGLYTLGVKKENDPQADGSSITYARRYALAAFVGVCPVDDDGESAMMRTKKEPLPPPPSFNEDQQAAIDGWKSAGKAEIKQGRNKQEWWVENKDSIIKECSEGGAKIVHAAVVK